MVAASAMARALDHCSGRLIGSRTNLRVNTVRCPQRVLRFFREQNGKLLLLDDDPNRDAPLHKERT